MEEVIVRADGLLFCPCCRAEVKAEYEAQDPAPCGCRWYWHDDIGRGHYLLVAGPSSGECRQGIDSARLFL